MALSVTVHTGPDPLTPGRQVPRRQWRALVLARAVHCMKTFKHDCRNLLFFVADARENEFFGYGDEETYLRNGLSLDPVTVASVADYLRAHGENAISFDAADDAAAKMKALDVQDQANQRPAHRPVSVDDENNDVNTSRPTGNSVAAALRRLRKDRPDIHARVLAGEITANAGMIDGGFRKKRPSKKQTPLEKMLKLLPKLNADDIAILRKELEAMP